MQTNYLQHVFDQKIFQKAVDKTLLSAESIRKRTGFDTIAFTGMSGAAMAFLLSHWMNVPLLCVRKKNDNSHYVTQTSRILEGNVHDVRKYLIVDDFIASGHTIQYVIDSIKTSNTYAECVGILMYASYSDRNWTHPVTRQVYDATACSPDT
jgi:adenine/guanine phosphoribosyltransferase-like PRPP-binding protein